MKIAIRVGGPASGGREGFEATLDYAVEAEKLGVDQAWSAEAWGMDAVAPLAFLAARTERLKVGTGIMQICARTPVNTAMTALSMHTITNGRFLLGLGNSGPQVVEGLHGQSFDRPGTRLRETVEVIRMACRGEKIAYDGETIVLPRRGGQGKAIRLSQPPAEIPIYLATLAPRTLELTGAIADGWLGTCFTPDAPEAHFAHLRKGAEGAGRSLDDIELNVAVFVGALRPPPGAGEAAARAVPDEMVWASTLLGDEARVRERIRLYRDVGVDCLLLDPVGGHPGEWIETLAPAVEMIRAECGSGPGGRDLG